MAETDRQAATVRSSGLRKFLRTPKGLVIAVLAVLLAIAAAGSGVRLVAPGVVGAIGAALLVDVPILRLRKHRWVLPDGALLTGMFVAMVLSPHEPWYVAAVTSALAVLSKYLLRAGTANIFNPAALALVATFYLFNSGQSWWGALPEVTPYALLLLIGTGVFVTAKVNKVPVVLSFLGAYYLLVSAAAFLGDPGKVAELYRAPDLHAALFFAFFMVTDPPTSSPRHRDQLLFGAITAVVSFAVFEIVGAAFYLLVGLLAANAWEAWRRARSKARKADASRTPGDRMLKHIAVPVVLALVAPALLNAQAPDQLIHATLGYGAPADGKPKPNFSPKGTQVALTAVPLGTRLPAGALRPAKRGIIKVGPDQRSWIPVLATSCTDHPRDLCQLFIDRNRNGNFADDGPGLSGTPTQNAKTKAWWTSINTVELSVPYTALKSVEPYLVNFWMVREDSLSAVEILRFSAGSWRQGKVTINGVEALVAAMDGDNNAVFDKNDSWSVLAAADSNAEKAVLSIAEARSTNRLMFVPGASKEQVLEFRSFSPDGRSVDFAVIDRPVTKLADRAPDDLLRDERPRPRATVAFEWAHGSKGYEAALAKAKAEGKRVFIDFEATWCGPCHTMDQWIWTDAEVAAKLNAGYLGVKVDADLEKALIKQFNIKGYPTMVILDSSGTEIKRFADYMGSKETLAFLMP